VASAVLQPLLTMGIFWLFPDRLAHLPSDGLPYPVFYFAGLVPWTYFSYSLNTATLTRSVHYSGSTLLLESLAQNQEDPLEPIQPSDCPTQV
jgi:hypothetical protein